MTYYQGTFEKGFILKKILLVDDDETFRHLFAELLNKEFETYEAVGVCDALKMLETLNEIENENLHRALLTADKRTLQIVLLKMQEYSTNEMPLSSI